jgi:hypothetical protein
MGLSTSTCFSASYLPPCLSAWYLPDGALASPPASSHGGMSPQIPSLGATESQGCRCAENGAYQEMRWPPAGARGARRSG